MIADYHWQLENGRFKVILHSKRLHNGKRDCVWSFVLEATALFDKWSFDERILLANLSSNEEGSPRNTWEFIPSRIKEDTYRSDKEFPSWRRNSDSATRRKENQGKGEIKIAVGTEDVFGERASPMTWTSSVPQLELHSNALTNTLACVFRLANYSFRPSLRNQGGSLREIRARLEGRISFSLAAIGNCPAHRVPHRSETSRKLPARKSGTGTWRDRLNEENEGGEEDDLLSRVECELRGRTQSSSAMHRATADVFSSAFLAAGSQVKDTARLWTARCEREASV